MMPCFECSGIRLNKGGGGGGGGGGVHSESPPVIQEIISQGAYHTHTQMISRVCLCTEPDY